jgi:protein-S-isoprenylcysteine O-methyltransferase Ste14
MDEGKRNRASLMGEAPRLLVPVLPLLIVALVGTLVLPSFFMFEGKWRGVAFAIGIELIALGILFWLSAAIGLIAAFKANRIAVHGAYGLCRHPIFSWWIFSVLPGLALLVNSWAFIVVVVVLYIVVIPAARREEVDMMARFGDGYRSYRDKTRMLWPIPLFKPFTVSRYIKAVGILIGLGVFALIVLLIMVLPIALGFGTTTEERTASMPGDANITGHVFPYTQAIDISAPADDVWQWLIQVGYRRAGWYNFDAINRVAGKDYFIDGNGSSRRIVPELQNLAAGDLIYLAPPMPFKVLTLERPNLLILAAPPSASGSQFGAVWTFSLRDEGSGKTRLVTRFRTVSTPGFMNDAVNFIFNSIGGAIIQQPAMLQGLKERAELSSSGS